jgi:predicted AAA+ superfamily ATPase
MIAHTDKLKDIESGFIRSQIVSITGFRQSVKTTLAKDFASQYQVSCTHFDLEDPRSLGRLSEPMKALENLSLDHLFVVYPGKEDYPLDKNLTVTSLPSVLSKIEDL